jgi:hypothetical protein
VIAVALPIVLAGAAPRASACDSSSCLLVTRGQSGLLPAKSFRLDVSFRQTDLTERMRGGDLADQVLRPKVDFETQTLRPGYHDELGGRDRFLQLDLGYGVGARTSLLASIAVYAHRSFDIGHPPVVTENYVTHGNGDLLIGVRHAFLARPGDSLVAGLSLEAPLGRHRLESPAGRADEGILDPMLQPGSGSFDVVASLQYAHRISAAGLGLTWAASYQHNGTNDLEYRVGSDAIASVSASRALVGRLSGTLQLKWTRRARSEFVDEPVPGSGGRVTYLTPGLSLPVGSRAGVYSFLSIPIRRYVNEEQLAPQLGFVLGVSRSF